MAVYVLEPKLGPEMLISIFQQLAVWQAHLNLGIKDVEGCILGYTSCLIDMFGAAADEVAIQTFENRRSYVHVLDQIMSDDKIEHLMSNMEKSPSLADLLKIDLIIHGTVRKFVRENLSLVTDAIKSL